MASRAASAVILAAIALLTGAGPATAAHNDPGWKLPGGGIYVSDATGSRWPVGTAARTWSDRTDVTLRYTTGGCRPGYPCVRVREQRNCSADWVGRTSYGSRSVRRVALNNCGTGGYSDAERRSLVCHELGHALGLDHRRSLGSCMATAHGASVYPDAHDVQLVNALY